MDKNRNPQKLVKMGVKKIKEETKELEKGVREKAGTYITAGLGLVAALAWNEAIKSLIEYLFPLNQNTMIAKFIYAFLMTLILVIVAQYLLKSEKKENEKS